MNSFRSSHQANGPSSDGRDAAAATRKKRWRRIKEEDRHKELAGGATIRRVKKTRMNSPELALGFSRGTRQTALLGTLAVMALMAALLGLLFAQKLPALPAEPMSWFVPTTMDIQNATIAVVPEPSRTTLTLLALAATVMRRRR